MRVILNVDAVSPPLTGIGRYTLRLAQGLRVASAIDGLRCYSAHRWIDDPDTLLEKNAPIAAVRKRIPAPARTLALRAYFLLRQARFGWAARKCRDDLLHAPNYILMRHAGPCVATVHDYSWVHYPQFHPRERVAVMHREMPRTCRLATRFITGAEFIKREMVAISGIAAQRIHVVPHGVDACYQPRSAEACTPLLAGYGLVHGGYLLSVATLEPRKNLVRLLRAFALLPSALRRRCPLVLVGGRGWHDDEIGALAARMERTGEVRRLGYVPEAELPLLYAGARAFAFVSLYEGFGLPPLEAMASGVPVVCSNASAMPEVVGTAAALIDPLDETAITGALQQALEDDVWRAGAVTRGLEQASQFTWERTVRETIAVYEEAMEQ